MPQGFNAGRKPRRFEDGTEPEREPPALLGRMQLPRRDIERLRQILGLQRRLLDLEASPRARRALIHRGPFNESLTWLDIHGRAPEVLEHWKGFLEGTVLPQEVVDADQPGGAGGAGGRGRRRRAAMTARTELSTETPVRRGRRLETADPGIPCSELRVPVLRDYHAAARLTVRPLELAHEVDQRVDARLGERVVDRRAHAADRAVALQAVEARPRSTPSRTRFSSSSLASRNVTFISERSALSRRRPPEPGAIQLGVELAGLALVHLRDRRQSALRLQPLQHEAQDVDRESTAACCTASRSPRAPRSSASCAASSPTAPAGPPG